MKSPSLILIFAGIIFIGAVVALPVVEEPETEWMILADMENHLHYVNLRQNVPEVYVDKSKVTFYYFSRRTLSHKLKLETVNKITNTDFDPNRKTMLIIHGWISNGQSQLNKIITSALLEVDDWNVFNLDWREHANHNYPYAKGAIQSVAEITAQFVEYLKDHAGLQTDQLYIAGHSLGAHLAGKIGELLHGQIAYIIGLDPAWPMFYYNNLKNRLDPSDAKYVQVIHTNGGLLGFMLPLGHADFYPNGGKFQNGCGIDIFGICSHSRSYIYFGESILKNNFLSHACKNFNDFSDGLCIYNQTTHMGGSELDISANGSYFLNTAKNKPFGLS